jgi:predicted RNase H-like nuclease (RuvC/YqgF family)
MFGFGKKKKNNNLLLESKVQTLERVNETLVQEKKELIQKNEVLGKDLAHFTELVVSEREIKEKIAVSASNEIENLNSQLTLEQEKVRALEEFVKQCNARTTIAEQDVEVLLKQIEKYRDDFRKFVLLNQNRINSMYQNALSKTSKKDDVAFVDHNAETPEMDLGLVEE